MVLHTEEYSGTIYLDSTVYLVNVVSIARSFCSLVNPGVHALSALHKLAVVLSLGLLDISQ